MTLARIDLDRAAYAAAILPTLDALGFAIAEIEGALQQSLDDEVLAGRLRDALRWLRAVELLTDAGLDVRVVVER